MSETLLSGSAVWLFGREMKDIQLIDADKRKQAYRGEASDIKSKTSDGKTDGKGEDDPNAPRRLSPDSLLRKQLVGDGATLARIYGFTFNNEYVDLAKPAIFLVHGPGVAVDGAANAAAGAAKRPSLHPADADHTGLVALDGGFSTGMRAWLYDRDDFSLRLDMMSGSLSRILLDVELGAGDLTGYARGATNLGQPTAFGESRRGGRRRWRGEDD